MGDRKGLNIIKVTVNKSKNPNKVKAEPINPKSRTETYNIEFTDSEIQPMKLEKNKKTVQKRKNEQSTGTPIIDELLNDSFEYFDTQMILNKESEVKRFKSNISIESNVNSFPSSSSLGTVCRLEDVFIDGSCNDIIAEFSDDLLNSNIKEECLFDDNLPLENKTNDFQFTQFCDSTQVVNQINAVISENTKNGPQKSLDKDKNSTITNCDIKINYKCDEEKESNDSTILQNISTSLKPDSILSSTFNDTMVNKNIDTLFEKYETLIHGFGKNQDTSLNPNLNKIEDILNRTFNSPETIKKIMETAEEAIKSSNPSLNLTDDSFLADAVINLSMDGVNIGEIIKKSLLYNAKKPLSPEKAINATLVDDEYGFHSKGPFFGLPEKVMELIKVYKGIDNLYKWQNECLNLPAIKERKNLIYALPTSGGKTLVAEILVLREILCRKKNVVFILPYVAIVQEKVWSLSPFAVALEFLIEEYAAGKGNYPPRKRRRKNSVYICTIEKGLGLINSLIEMGRLNEIGLVVVDELHLLGEEKRGCTLEGLLTKIIYLKENIQVVGMSATIGNLDEICTFLNADVYTNNFRPVELVEYVKCGNEIAKVDTNATCEEDKLIFDRKVNFKYADPILKIDPDMLGGLVMEVIPKDSCLIFCKTKQNCENVAVLLCKVVFKNLKKYKVKEKESLKKALKEEVGSLCNVLELSLTYGIAYHHSGLTSEERRIIEEGFRQGIISVICCTSTLAAGVNLPAKRVIIRNPYIGRDFINLARYKQMIGRAGRAGLGELGESIVIVEPRELPLIQKLFNSPMDLAISGMPKFNASGYRQFLLSCVSLGLGNTLNQLQDLANTTLMAIQKDRLGSEINVKKMTQIAIKQLFKMGALEVDDGKEKKIEPDDNNLTVKLDNTMSDNVPDVANTSVSTTQSKKFIKVTKSCKIIISKMGKAAIRGGLDLGHAHILYEDLMTAQSSLVLFTGLHLMYLVTPYDISEQVKPNKLQYYNIYLKLNIREVHTAKVLGFTEAVACKLATNKRIVEVPERVLNRFYVTLMLYDLWNEMPLHEVANKYDINRGLIQNLMTSAASFASNVFHFCEEFEDFWAFSLLLKGMSDRLSHCCVKELVPLMNLPSVKQNRARQLYQAGYKTLQAVAKADPNDLIQNVEYMSNKLANQLIAAAKLILLERVENLREEAEDVLEGVEV